MPTWSDSRDVLDRDLAVVEAIAREAGQILLSGWEQRPAIEYKSADRDIVTEFDKRIHQAMLDVLNQVQPPSQPG